MHFIVNHRPSSNVVEVKLASETKTQLKRALFYGIGAVSAIVIVHEQYSSRKNTDD